MIGTRPAACSTETRMISQCSSIVTVGDSPVVPTTPMQSVPSAMCQSISLRRRVVVDAAVFLHRRDQRHDAANDGFHADSFESQRFYPAPGGAPSRA